MNKSLFTKSRRMFHELSRELTSGVIDNPFASYEDKSLAYSLINQIDFCLSISTFEDVSTQASNS